MSSPVKRARRERFEDLVREEGFFREYIGQRLLDGETLEEICNAKNADIPSRRVWNHLHAEEGRKAWFYGILKAQAAQEVEGTLPIADGCAEEGPAIRKAELRIATRFKRAQFYDPDRFAPAARVDGAGLAEGFAAALQRISERKQRALAGLAAPRVVEAAE